MIEITFTAKDLDDLCRQMEPFFGAALEAVPAPAAPREAPPARKAKAPKPEPAAEPPQEEPQVEEEELEAPVDARAKAAVDLLKLKNEQLDRLRELFKAGKGTFVRQLLQKYGEGAKVFPEVDAKQFPKIKREIDQELN